MTFLPLSDQALLELLALLDREDRYVFLETTRGGSEEYRSLLFLRPVDCLRCTAADSAARFFERAGHYLEKGYYLAGWFAYEFGYLLEPSFSRHLRPDRDHLLADLGVFPPPHVLDHRTGAFTGAGPWPQAPAGPRPDCAIDNLCENETRQDYLRHLARIKSYIAAGDTYQVNYTLKLRFDFSGSPQALYRLLRRNQSVSYCANLKLDRRHILSFSPELFFKKQGEYCTVRPMKGTIGRGITPEDDRRLADFLRNDIKNRSENVMIVDLLRNDLGRLSRPGTVRAASLFDVEPYETLHQMTSTITGRIRPDISLLDLFRALFPCGSVTGAPKIRTMEIIHELEKEARGVYTGGIGYISPRLDAQFNVPIRTVVLDGRHGEMGIGSGIVYDSDPEKEWEECLLKGRFLTDPAPDFKLIETMVWRPDGGFWLYDLHLARLRRSAGYFGFAFDRDAIETRLGQEAAGFAPPAPAMRVRLTLAKDGGMTVTATPCDGPAETFPPRAAADPAALPRITLAPETTDSSSPFLYHKTTRRDLYDAERRRALKAGFFEVLFANETGELTEGSISNILLKKDGRFLTPPVRAGLLNGVLRTHLLANHSDLVRETTLRPEDLASAEAIYLANSVRGVIQVRL